METFGQLTVLGREPGTIRDFLSAAEAHEDCREGKDQADQDAPAPDQEYPAFFKQAPQKKVCPHDGVCLLYTSPSPRDRG